jgi:PucR C-terminal helix-turn-helix domain/GGDEF-like domain
VRENAAARELIAELACEFAQRGDELAYEVAEQIHRGVVGVPADEELRGMTLQSGLEIIRQIVDRLRGGQDMAHFEPPGVSVDYARDYVHRRIELTTLLAVVRVGYAVFARQWSSTLRASEAPPAVITEALSTSLLDIFTYIDAISAELASAYSEERERWSRSIDAMRFDAARSILDGPTADTELVERRLGHRLDTTQRAFVVWSGAVGGADLHAALNRAAREIAERAGARDPLLLPLGSYTVAGWFAGEPARAESSRITAKPLQTPATMAIRATVGTPRWGTEGFRSSHNEALLARRIAQADPEAINTITAYEDVALAVLATSDPVHARAFVARELGDLAAGDAATRRFAKTALTYLQEGRNRARTSRRLAVHPNTVAYRLRRATELLGHDLNRRAAEVEVALTIAPLLGHQSLD